MKRFLLLFLVLLLLPAASCQRVVFAPDSQHRWGSVMPSPSPTLPSLPTPTPTPAPVTGDVTNVELTLSFSFGERTGLYTGTLKEDLPHGFGRFSTVSLQGVFWTYTGGWKDGHFHGQGTCVWEDGFMEEGEYQNDALHGEAREYINGVLRYEGGFADGDYHGAGTFYDLRGALVYNGAFEFGYLLESAVARDQRIGKFKQTCAALDYDALLADAQNETGTCAAVSGQVFYVFDPMPDMPHYCSFLMADPVAQDNIVCVVYLLSAGEKCPVLGQSVTVWGTAETLYEYATQLNAVISVPQLEAWSVEPDETLDGFDA